MLTQLLRKKKNFLFLLSLFSLNQTKSIKYYWYSTLIEALKILHMNNILIKNLFKKKFLELIIPKLQDLQIISSRN